MADGAFRVTRGGLCACSRLRLPATILDPLDSIPFGSSLLTVNRICLLSHRCIIAIILLYY